MHKRGWIVALILLGWTKLLVAQAGVQSHGASWVITEGSYVVVQDDFSIYESQQTYGSILLNGVLQLGGDWHSFAPKSPFLSLALSSGIVKMEGLHPQHIKGSFSTHFPRLSLSNPSNLYLENILEIGNVLEMHTGKIHTSQYEVDILSDSPSAIYSKDSSTYIVGQLSRKLKSGQYQFPIGDAHSLQLAKLILPAPISPEKIGISFIATPQVVPLNLHIAGGRITHFLDNGYWTLIRDEATNSTLDLELYASGHSNGGATASQHTMLFRKNDSWEEQGLHHNALQTGSGISTIKTVRRQITDAGDFAIAISEYSLSIPHLNSLSAFTIANNGSFDRQIEVRFYASHPVNCHLILSDLSGKQLLKIQQKVHIGLNTIPIDLTQFSSSVYILTLQNGREIHRRSVW